MRILNISPINFVSSINFKKKEIENPISKDAIAQNEAPSAIDSYGRAVVQKRNNIKNEAGEVRFWTITNNDGFSLYNKDGALIYEKAKTSQGLDKETYFSLDGKKTHSKEFLPNGQVEFKFYNEKGEVERISTLDYVWGSKIKQIIPKPPISKETKDKRPEYLYHITLSENYEQIKQEGFKVGYERDLTLYGDDAVFFISEHDLTNTWCNLTNNSDTTRNDSLLARLLKYCSKDDTSELAIFKIATSTLDVNALRLRDENDVMCSNPQETFIKGQDLEDYYLLTETLSGASNHHCNNFEAKNICDEIFLSERNKRLRQGLPLDLIEDFKNKPLEYYHTKDVAPEAIVASCKFDISEILEADETEESCELTSRAIIQDCLDRMK